MGNRRLRVCYHTGWIGVQLFAWLISSSNVQSFLQTEAEPLRAHARSVLLVCNQEAQRGVGRALLRRAAAQRRRGIDRRGWHRENPVGPLPAPDTDPR